MTKSIVFLILGLTAGAVVGYVAGVGSVDEGSPDWSIPSLPDPPDPGASAGEELRDDVTPAGSGTPLSQAIRSIGVSPVPRGDGRITGRILTADGKPVADVLVRAAPTATRAGSSWHPGEGPPRDRDLDRRVREFVQLERGRRSARREALTDAEGRYTFIDLADTPHRIRAWRENYRVDAKSSGKARRAKPGSTVDFVAVPLVRLPIAVLLPDGGSPPSAKVTRTVRTQGGSSSRTHDWTRRQPYLWVELGSCELHAGLTRGGAYTSNKETVEITADGELPSVVLRLTGVSGISGVITWSYSRPASQHTRVRYLRFEEKDPSEEDLLEAKSEWVDGDGIFQLRDLAPGTWRVGVGGTHDRVDVHRDVVVEAGSMTSVEIEVPAPDPSSYVVVHVKNPDGKPATDCTFSSGRRSQHGSSSGGGSVLFAERGTYWVPHYSSSSGDDMEGDGVTWYITVESPRYGRRELTYGKATAQEFSVQFTAPALLVATVSGYVGSGLEGKLSLSMRRSDSGEARYQMRSGKMTASGECQFGPAEPGAYELRLNGKVQRYQTSHLATQQVVLVAGENRIQVAIPTLYALTVVVPSPKSGMEARLRNLNSQEWSAAEAKVGKDGRATLKMLKADRYELSVSSLRGQMTVDVPGPSVVEFAPKEPNALQVTVSDPSGYLGKIGLQTGDMMIAMDGKSFKDEATMMAVFVGSRAKKEVSCTVLRGGRTFVVRLNVVSLMGRSGEMGGSLRPAVR